MPAKKNSPSKHDVRDYAAFLRGIHLVALGLTECQARVNRDSYFDLLDKKVSARGISTDYALLEVEKEFFNVSAALRLRVEDKQNTSASAPPALLVDCKYEAHFHGSHCEITQQFAKRFAESELRLIMWPYFRQLINDLSSRMAIPPILIPFSTAQGSHS